MTNKLFLVFLSIFVFPVLAGYGQSESEIFEQFWSYRDHAFAAASPELPEEARRSEADIANALRDKLLRNDRIVIETLTRALEGNNGELSVGQKVEVIRFFSIVKIGSNEMLPIVREIVRSADLNEDPAPLLSASATYLYDFGDKSDIELLERLKGHINPAFASLAEFGIKKLEQGESLRQPPPSSLQGEGTPENETPVDGESSPQELEKNAESSSPIWPFVVGAITLLGVAIILLRLPKRGG